MWKVIYTELYMQLCRMSYHRFGSRIIKLVPNLMCHIFWKTCKIKPQPSGMVNMLGFMQPRFWFAFWAASPNWHLMSNFFIHQCSKILLCRAALNPFITSLCWYWNVQTQVQDLVLGLVEYHEDHTGWLFKPAKVPLTGSPSLPHVNCTTQIGAVHKLADVHSIPLCHWWRY